MKLMLLSRVDILKMSRSYGPEVADNEKRAYYYSFAVTGLDKLEKGCAKHTKMIVWSDFETKSLKGNNTVCSQYCRIKRGEMECVATCQRRPTFTAPPSVLETAVLQLRMTIILQSKYPRVLVVGVFGEERKAMTRGTERDGLIPACCLHWHRVLWRHFTIYRLCYDHFFNFPYYTLPGNTGYPHIIYRMCV